MADIIIGSRRPRTTSPWRTVAVVSVLVAVAVITATVTFGRLTRYPHPAGDVANAPLTAGDDGLLRFGAASLERRGRLNVVRVSGTPHAIGAAHGRLLAEAFGPIATSLLPTLDNAISTDGAFGETTLSWRSRWLYRLIDDGIPGHQLIEHAGAARGAAAASDDLSPGYEALVKAEAAIELGVADPAAPVRPSKAVSRSIAAVARMRSAFGDRIGLGYSLSLPGALDGGASVARSITVSMIAAEGVLPFVRVGSPANVGVFCGVNSEGLAIAVLPTLSAAVVADRGDAQPAALVARDILENARSLDEALGVLEKTRPLGAAVFVVVDGPRRTWARVERTHNTIDIAREPKNSATADVLTSLAFREDAVNDRARRTRLSDRRAARARELLRGQPFDSPDDLAAVLRDRRGPGGAALPAGHPGAIDDGETVLSAIIDPTTMVLWVSEGPGPRARMRAFDLRYELMGRGDSPAPPADIEAAADFDPGGDDVLWNARARLRSAVRLWSAGQRARAREQLERALALAPDLPAAHRVAGELLRDAGDQRWRGHLERYLELGPDDLGAAEEFRALLGRPGGD